MPEPKSGHDDTMRIAFMVNNKPDLRIISVSTPLQSIIQVRIETVDHLVYSPFNQSGQTCLQGNSPVYR